MSRVANQLAESPMQHSLTFVPTASAGLELTALFSTRITSGSSGEQAMPQDFSPCLSVPGYAWLDRTDSKQASACWSVSVGGLPLEICPRSLEICGFSPASAEVENATAWRYTARFGVQVSGESRVSGMFSPETYCCSFLIYCDGILMSLMVEFLIYFFKKPTVCL